MRVQIQPYVKGRTGDPYRGVPLGDVIERDFADAPQPGDVLPPIVPGHTRLTVVAREWVPSGAGLVLRVEAVCREVGP